MGDVLVEGNAVLGGPFEQLQRVRYQRRLSSINDSFVDDTQAGGFLCLP